MADRATKLLESLGRLLAQAAPQDWREMELRISGAGGMTQTVVSATRADGSVDGDCELDDAGDDAAVELRMAMYQPSTGTWYDARLRLDRDGLLDADFNYDTPPFDGDADPRLLIEDQHLFPRDAEALPAWHPSRDS